MKAIVTPLSDLPPADKALIARQQIGPLARDLRELQRRLPHFQDQIGTRKEMQAIQREIDRLRRWGGLAR